MAWRYMAVYGIAWRASHGIGYGLARHSIIWHGLAMHAMAWPGVHGTVYGMALWAWHGIW